MNTTKLDAKLIGFTTVAALLGVGFAMAMSASADTGLGYGAGRGECDTDRHAAIEAAMDSGDYTAWLELMDGRGRVTEVVTADNFHMFVDMHEAMEDGDTEKAQELREDLGLGMRKADGTGRGPGGQGKGMGMHRAGR